MNCKLDDVKDNLRQIKDMYAGLQEEVSCLRQEVVDVKVENQSLQEVPTCPELHEAKSSTNKE